MSWLSTVLRTKVIALGAKKRLLLASFQSRVTRWVTETFGTDFRDDGHERDARFMEEAIELFQARGNSLDQLWMLAQYVYSREPGDVRQEVGGVQTTLAALCAANDIDMRDAAETELARMWTKVEAIRAKAATKPKNSPLPGHYPGQRMPENNWHPTEQQITSACYSYDHAFGLKKKEEQQQMRFTAQCWIEAWMKELPRTPMLRMQPPSTITDRAVA